jgi:ParB family chromosome partitioning protein
VARGGLGRGLGSLLGGAPEVSQPNKPQNVERIVIDERETIHHSPYPPNLITNHEIKKEIEDESVSRETIEENVIESNSDFINLKISQISPNPEQPRTNFKEEELIELSESIKREGLIQPIVVRKLSESNYQIIAGERRWQAAKRANLEEVPVYIKDIDDNKALELALIENLQRSDLNPIEEAYGYKRLMERKKMTQADIAQAMSKGRSTIANALRLLDLPEDAQQLLFEDKITAGHARAILSIDNKEGREKLTNKLKDSNMSVREAESLARLFNINKSNTNKVKTVVPQSYKSVAKNLKDQLNTNVKVKSLNGKNKIEIEFKDEDDLERIFKQLSNS